MYNEEKRSNRREKLKIAIIYTTKGGTTRECAELLSRELKGQDVTVADMSEAPDLDMYDTVVIGFPIRAAKPAKAARKYIKANTDALLKKRVAYYMCCGFIDCAEEYAEKALPKELSERGVAVTCLGGSLDPTRFKGIDKMIVKAVRAEILGGGENGDQRDDMTIPTILDENIAQLASLLKSFCVSEK